MIEMGELREGILRDNVINFYEKLFKLSNIEVIGLGTNLGCMYGVEPTYDKLIQLSLYEQLIEAIFNHKLELVSGGSSITLPLIKKGRMPQGVNHFRIGEAALLGTSPLDGRRFLNLHRDVFSFHSSIVELYRKENTPDGTISDANIGHTAKATKNGMSYKAIMDFGLLDSPPDHVTPMDRDIRFVGNSSDMTVFDLGSNDRAHRVGSALSFTPDYLGVANLMGSRFVEKRLLRSVALDSTE
jgi:predicted amino acid racemase